MFDREFDIDPTAVIEAAAESILVTTTDLDAPGPYIVYVNPAFERMTGWSRTEVLGESPRILQGPNTDLRIFTNLREKLHGNQIWEGNTINYRKDGSEFWIEWSIVPLKNEHGEIDQYVAIQRDISARIEAERHLQEAQDAKHLAERAYASLSRYFSPNLAERLASDSDAVDLGGRWQEIATLFTDIAGFTTLVETIEPTALAPLLNDYLAGMTDIVFAHDGTVTRIVGDALHILFGAPGEQPDYANRAVACALALDTYAQSFRKIWQKKGLSLGATRVGAHAGRAIVGNFGGDRFFDYTAHGDTINIAARLETANKHLGTRICISSELAAMVADFKGRPIGDLVLRGRSTELQAFEPMPAEAYENAATQDYLNAFAQLEAGDSNARASFAALVAAQPNDPLANFHLKRLLNGATGTRIELE